MMSESYNKQTTSHKFKSMIVKLVSFEAAFDLTNTLLQAQGEIVDEVDKAILHGAWHDTSYKDMAKVLPIKESNLRTAIAPKLWQRVAKAFGVETISKRDFKELVLQRMQRSLPSVTLQSAREPIPSAPLSVIGGQPPNIDVFFGRKPELAMLSEAVKESKLIGLIGPAGIGKSSLAAKLVERCTHDPKTFNFELCLWKSIAYNPSVDELVKDLLFQLGVISLKEPFDSQALISLLIQQLHSRRCLLLLDSVEAVMKGTSRLNPLGVFGEYRSLFNRIVEEQHHSCLILASQEPLTDIELLRNKGFATCSCKIEGMGKDAHELLRNLGMKQEEEWSHLIDDYSGNPLALSLVAANIQKFFGGNIKEFLKRNTTSVADIFITPLTTQINRLSGLEKKVLEYFAEVTSSTFLQLGDRMKETSITQLMQALERLEARSLLEQTEEQPLTYTITPVVKKFITANSEVIIEAEYTLVPA
jgi:hypothetical protein